MSALVELEGNALSDAVAAIMNGQPAAGVVGNPRLDQHPAQALRNLLRSDADLLVRVQNEYSNLLASFLEAEASRTTEGALIELLVTAAELPVRGSGRPIALGFSKLLHSLGEVKGWWTNFSTDDPQPVVFRWFEAMAANQSGKVLAPRWASSLERSRNSKVMMAVWAGHALANPEGGLISLGTLLNKVDVKTTNAFGLGTLVGSLLPELDFDQVALLRAAQTLRFSDTERIEFLDRVPADFPEGELEGTFAVPFGKGPQRSKRSGLTRGQ
jgi:hypothetical protein